MDVVTMMGLLLSRVPLGGKQGDRREAEPPWLLLLLLPLLPLPLPLLLLPLLLLLLPLPLLLLLPPPAPLLIRILRLISITAVLFSDDSVDPARAQHPCQNV